MNGRVGWGIVKVISRCWGVFVLRIQCIVILRINYQILCTADAGVNGPINKHYVSDQALKYFDQLLGVSIHLHKVSTNWKVLNHKLDGRYGPKINRKKYLKGAEIKGDLNPNIDGPFRSAQLAQTVHKYLLFLSVRDWTDKTANCRGFYAITASCRS